MERGNPPTVNKRYNSEVMIFESTELILRRERRKGLGVRP